MNTLEKEIAEQAELLNRFGEKERDQISDVVKIIEDVNTSSGRVFLFASGSSLNACLYARELFSRDNDIVLDVFPAGEVENHADDINNDDLVILVSQSGESGDILKVNQLIRKSVNRVIITNNIESTLTKGIETVIGLKAGEEKAVPATKTYFATLLIFTMLSEAVSGRIEVTDAGSKISGEIKNILTEKLKNLRIEELKNKKIYILGSGVGWPQAMEAELKFKEITKADAESYEMSEFMHGPVEMLDEDSVVIIFCPKLCDEMDNKILSKIKNHKSRIMVIGNCECEEADELIKIKNKKYFELISIVAIQKIALKMAKEKGIDLESVEADKVVK